MRASPPSPSRTKIAGDAVPFRAVLVLLCRGGRPCPPCMTAAPCRAGPVCPAVTGVGIRLPSPPSEREVSARSADGGRDATRFLSPSRLRRQPPPRGGLTARRCRADGTAKTPSPTKMTTLSGGHFLRFYALVSEPARPRWGCWRPETHRCRCAWWWRRPC